MTLFRSACLWFALGGLAATAGCGAAEDAPGGTAADAEPVSEFACSETMTGGDAFDLSLGYRPLEGDYTEFPDGGSVPMVIGYQGLYMLVFESHATVAFDTDRVCFDCAIDVSPSSSGTYPGTSQHGPIDFVAMSTGAFAGGFNVVLGPTSEHDAYAGAEVEIAMTCEGHGITGNVGRSFVILDSN